LLGGEKINSTQWDYYAEDYHNHIISPLQKGIDNPIYNEIKKISNRKELVVADIGTGRGDILPFLSENFKEVYAIDFSPKMIRVAEERNHHLKNTHFKCADIRELTKLEKKFDVIITVNSIMLPSPAELLTAFEQIYTSIKTSGYLLGVFPSMETILYFFTLVYERELAKYNDEKKALTMTKRIVEKKKYDFISGIFNDEGEKQKFYYKFELFQRLTDAGFDEINITKVLYPWGTGGDFSGFDDKQMMWDWFVSARKL